MLCPLFKLCLGSFVENREAKTKHFVMTGLRLSREISCTECTVLLCNHVEHVVVAIQTLLAGEGWQEKNIFLCLKFCFVKT